MSLDKCLVQGLDLTPLTETKTEHGPGKDDPKGLPEVFDSGLREEIYRLTDGGLISVGRLLAMIPHLFSRIIGLGLGRFLRGR